MLAGVLHLAPMRKFLLACLVALRLKAKPVAAETNYHFLKVPKEHREKFARYYDAMLATPNHHSRLRFWGFVEDEVFPNRVQGKALTVIWLNHTNPAVRWVADEEVQESQGDPPTPTVKTLSPDVAA